MNIAISTEYIKSIYHYRI